MKLRFSSAHKSIRFFPEIDLPDLVVLTGINGAGKSHLLEALEQGFVRVDEIPFNGPARTIRRFDWTNLVPNDNPAFTGYQSKQERSGLWTQFSNDLKQNLPQLYQTVASDVELANLSARELVDLTPHSLVSRGFSNDKAESTVAAIQSTAISLSQNVGGFFNQGDPQNRPRFVQMLRAASTRPIISFEEEDFYEHFPPTWQPVDMFQQSFARLFAEYQENWRHNEYKQWQNSRGKKFRFLDDEAFIKKYGNPPWEFVNNILETAKLDFRINAPNEVEDLPYEPILTDTVRGTQVKFADLSSGEKVLMSFALCLYYANDPRQVVEYPQLLLFDEIDAPLHPSMTKSLLETIEKILVKQQKIKVILTTHSPSTVALAPEDSLFVMRKDGAHRMGRISKDGALSILMSGVPSLSMNYENRRQVFVESHHDVGFYEKFYEKSKPYLVPDISLNFIASGASATGGCAHVKDIVGKFFSAGNKTIYGIIDWDTKNFGDERVKVLGAGQRYSIENYIFDPLLVAMFLTREKIWERADVGLGENDTYIDFSKMDDAQLQKIADIVISKIFSNISTKGSVEPVLCKYIGGQSVFLPMWFMKMQGHELESILKTTFPQLNAFHREGELKSAVLKKVVDDVPSLIPTCILNIFKDIQQAELRH
jgi:energy-coupling factor transporter ATP-binding protein EcfA2